MYQVLLVEDEVMILEINRQYIERVPNFIVADMAQSIEEAIQLTKKNQYDLIFIDYNLKGQSATKLMKYLREINYQADFILLTAQKDKESVQQSIQYGAIDYILKPFSFERLKQSLLHYEKRQQTLEGVHSVDQEILDQLYKLNNKKANSQDIYKEPLEKGITSTTLEIIIEAINTYQSTFSVEDLMEYTDFSHVTIRKYLSFLEERKYLKSYMNYETNGRPKKYYRRIID